jgi:hypothetical protein
LSARGASPSIREFLVTANAFSPDTHQLQFSKSHAAQSSVQLLTMGPCFVKWTIWFFQLPFWNCKRFLSSQRNHIASVLNIISTTCFLLLIQSRTTDSKLLHTWTHMILARSQKKNFSREQNSY